MGKRLYRSRDNKVFAGICGGVGEYLNIDPAIIRIVWALFAFTGAGIIAYLAALFIMPEGNPYDSKTDTQNDFGFSSDKNTAQYDSGRNSVVIGAALVIFGALFLLKQVFHWFDMSFFWPLVLILVGIAIIYKGRGKSF